MKQTGRARTEQARHDRRVSKAVIAEERDARDARIAELEAEAEAVKRAVKCFTGEDVAVLLEMMREKDAPYAARKR